MKRSPAERGSFKHGSSCSISEDQNDVQHQARGEPQTNDSNQSHFPGTN